MAWIFFFPSADARWLSNVQAVLLIITSVGLSDMIYDNFHLVHVKNMLSIYYVELLVHSSSLTGGAAPNTFQHSIIFLKQVLGPNIFFWLCPISRNVGNGVRFRASYDTTLSKPSRWCTSDRRRILGSGNLQKNLRCPHKSIVFF